MRRALKYEIAGAVGQWIGLLAVIAAIAAEVVYEADIWFVAMTLGSLIWGIGTKVRGH